MKEPSITETSNILYGIYDNECGTLVDRHNEEAGDFSYDTKILTNREVLVVDNISMHDDKKALYADVEDAQHVKWLLEQENPDNSYTVVSFTECVYRYYAFNTVDEG